MNIKEKRSKLEEAYVRLFGESSNGALRPDESLEQPYLGTIVPTVTIYSSPELASTTIIASQRGRSRLPSLEAA